MRLTGNHHAATPFFAIPLPPPLQQTLIQWRAEHFSSQAGRPIAAANLHLTLAFLGDVGSAQQQRLQTLAGRIRQAPFSLTLDDAGQWPRPGVVWLGMRRAPRGLIQLAELLRSQAARSGCYQSPLPFHPHITLLRHAYQAVAIPAATFRWSFDVTHFSLFSSQQSQGRTRYQPLASWPLRRDD
ncbi:RNA 2',3'-cyclic phosphodiesterase [Edwardsiella piscicida]|nr:RNA 2',3'-cyclic phosphodiesterase [Edwardsiella piscicida]